MDFKNNKYNTSWCFTSQDLFDNINFKKFGWSKNFYKLFKTDRWKKVVGKIFTYFMYQVILDIIENNITFELPLTGKSYAEFYVKSFMDEDFKNLYRKGKWNEIEFLNLNFTGYQIYFKYKTKNRVEKEKPVYISHKNARDIFYKNINEGKTYY